MQNILIKSVSKMLDNFHPIQEAQLIFTLNYNKICLFVWDIISRSFYDQPFGGSLIKNKCYHIKKVN